MTNVEKLLKLINYLGTTGTVYTYRYYYGPNVFDLYDIRYTFEHGLRYCITEKWGTKVSTYEMGFPPKWLIESAIVDLEPIIIKKWLEEKDSEEILNSILASTPERVY